MTVLVTGGAGYIGSHVILDLLAIRTPVVVIDNLSSGYRDLIPPGVPLIVADVGEGEVVAKVIKAYGVQTIMHFAAKLVVPESVADPLDYYLANTVKTRALLAVAVQADVQHFIFSSTAAVYGSIGADPVAEDHSLAPNSPYGASKMMSELMLKDVAAASSLRFAALRYFNVVGADPELRSGQASPRATHLMKVALQAALGQRSHVDVFGTDFPTPDGSGVRDYIHVSDLAAAHLCAWQALQSGGESFIANVGYGHGLSVFEVIEAVKQVSGVDFPVRIAPRRPGDVASVVARSDVIRAKTGWVPRYQGIERSVATALAWEKKLLRNA
jgi:UDP-glucose 4-epimerase